MQSCFEDFQFVFLHLSDRFLSCRFVVVDLQVAEEKHRTIDLFHRVDCSMFHSTALSFPPEEKIFDLSRIEDKCYIAITKFTFLVLLYRAVVSWEAILDEPNFKAFWLVLPPSLPPPPDPDPVPFGFSALSFNWWRNILAHYKLKKHLSEAIFLISCNVPEEKQQVPWSRHRHPHLIHSVKKIKSKNIATVTRAIFLGTNRSTESRIPFVHV